MSAQRHFADIACLPADTLRLILSYGAAFKAGRPPKDNPRPLTGKSLAMLFEKPSTRTRISFEVGMRQLGGYTVVLEQSASQWARGEPIADTARVLSRYVDAIMLRAVEHESLQTMCKQANTPVINGLTDHSHPCQIMADILTFEEHRGNIKDRHIAWIGDGNNVAVSWIQAAARFGFRLAVACPQNLMPATAVIDWAENHGGHIILTTNPDEAARDADCLVTDTWVSMGHKDPEARRELLRGYQVDAALMARAKPEALFMHCLPAHRGEEVTAEIIDGPQSVVWDEAENRLHAQKGILYWCLADD